LVVKSANRSYRVVTLGEADVAELWRLRWADESLAVSRIVEIGADTRSLRGAVRRMRPIPSDALVAADLDAAFHASVVALAGMPRLTARFADLSDLIRLVHVTLNTPSPVLVRGENLHSGHARLVDVLDESIASGDPAGALSAWREHLTP
jgi:DNA-binding GntR family transcriptional regulator